MREIKNIALKRQLPGFYSYFMPTQVAAVYGFDSLGNNGSGINIGIGAYQSYFTVYFEK